ncbi:MAG: PIN domain-containing protein [Desulfoferrobacter sp.]
MRFVDTNVFLRFLVNDDSQKADACEMLFKRAIEGEEALFTTDMVVAEIIWVLESYYKLNMKEIREKVEKILNTKNLECLNREIIINALAVSEEANIDYIDAYNAYMLKTRGITELYSYDSHYDRLSWLKRIEPAK